MDRNLKERIDKNARALRFISRQEMFEKNRKSIKDEHSYLKMLSESERSLILQSMSAPIPSELPPLSPTTISFYRRANKPVFRTKAVEGSNQFHPHMTYQSLFILGGIEQINFSNYQQILKEFQNDLQKYISCEFSEIRQMAMIAAGNKILGKEADILKIIELDPKQLWVMINHIYEKKISSTRLFSYLKENNQIIYKTLFQMSNTNDDNIIQSIMNNEHALQILIDGLNHYNSEIKKHSLRIFGNIMAEKQEYVLTLAKENILDHIYPFLNTKDNQVRRDACWAISNFSFEKISATVLTHNTKTIEKLIQMLQNQYDVKIKIELGHIFSGLIHYADKNDVFNIVHMSHLLERCGEFLQVEDPELINVILYLVSKIVELGDNFADDDGNCFVEKIKSSGLKSKIVELTYYAQNPQISKLASELQEKLEDEY